MYNNTLPNATDTILRIPKCNATEIEACDSPLSNMAVTKWENEGLVTTEQKICSVAVPGACPRVTCKNENGNYVACRMLAFIESQENESGFWMRLPCSSCSEKRELHPITKGLVYDTNS